MWRYLSSGAHLVPHDGGGHGWADQSSTGDQFERYLCRTDSGAGQWDLDADHPRRRWWKHRNGDSGQHCSGYSLPGNSHSNSNSNANADADTDSDAYGHGKSYSHSHAHPNSNTYTYSYSDGDSHAFPHPKPYSVANTHSRGTGHQSLDPHARSDRC